MKRLVVRQAFAALWMFVLSTGTAGIAISQETQAASVPSRQELGQRAVKFVVDRFGIDPTNMVPKTNQPLSAKGSWSISKETPPICAKINLPCVLLSYTEPGTDVICQWTMLFGSHDGLLLDLNEEAVRYFTSKPYDKNNPKNDASPGRAEKEFPRFNRSIQRSRNLLT